MSNVAFGSRKKNILEQPRASPFWQVSRLLRDLRGLRGLKGFEGFEGQAPMSNVAFGSRKKTKTF